MGGRTMRQTRSLLLVGASLALAACAGEVDPTAPEGVAKSFAQSNDKSGNNGGGYTWTIKKEMVEVHLMDANGGMAVDPVSPYNLKVNETKWFEYRITYTRTNGGSMGPTAVISDDVATACYGLGAGFSCTSTDSDFGIEFGGGAIGVKTWTVTASGSKVGMLDVHNGNAGCPRDRSLKNTATLTSNGKTKSSDTETPVSSDACGVSNEKPACNQGVGNGPEGCDPGNSDAHKGSNDENGGTPGNPGRKGGGH